MEKNRIKEEIIKILLKAEVKQLKEAVEISDDKITLTSQAEKVADQIFALINTKKENEETLKARIGEALRNKIKFIDDKEHTYLGTPSELITEILKAVRCNKR